MLRRNSLSNQRAKKAHAQSSITQHVQAASQCVQLSSGSKLAPQNKHELKKKYQTWRNIHSFLMPPVRKVFDLTMASNFYPNVRKRKDKKKKLEFKNLVQNIKF